MKNSEKKPKIFINTKILNLGVKSMFEMGRAENDEIPKSLFPFQIQSQPQNSNKVIVLASLSKTCYYFV